MDARIISITALQLSYTILYTNLMRSSTRAEIYLLVITMIWGATFPLIHTSVKDISPVAFVFLRFFIAALLFLPFVLGAFKHTTRRLMVVSVVLGAINFSSYFLQTTALKTISADQVAFITGLSIVMVPFLSALFKSEKLRKIDVIASLIALLGLYVLTGANLEDISVGQVLTFIAAFLYALAIVIIQVHTKVACRYDLMAFYQILFTAIFALPFAVHQDFSGLAKTSVAFTLLFCSFFATVIALYVQVRFQRMTTASKAALIFCLEPIFASFFAWLIDHQRVGVDTYIGGAIILVGLATPDLLKVVKRKRVRVRRV
jgi:drug/metabolite transporter (DMT)-like permease